MVGDNNVYRFTLQFNGETEENKRAGEFLNTLKNRKSVVVVAALNEYLDNHPDRTIEVKVSSAITERTVRKLIEEIVADKLSNFAVKAETATGTTGELDSAAIEEDVVTMLDNLDLFD